jgi:hypothetical protein
VQTSDGRVVDVDGVETREGSFEVYNFKVEGFHSYFVSDLGVLVHNACDPVGNMKEFFGTEFGSSLSNSVQKTSKQYQGQSIYTVTKKVDNEYLKKDDRFYLDNLHKDHLEVFDRRGKFQAVLNLDGSLNQAKTNAGFKQGRTIK